MWVTIFWFVYKAWALFGEPQLTWNKSWPFPNLHQTQHPRLILPRKKQPLVYAKEVYLKKDFPTLCPISTYKQHVLQFLPSFAGLFAPTIFSNSLRRRVATRGRRFAAHDFASQCDLKRWRLGGQTHEGFLSGLSGEIVLSAAVVAVT